MRCLAAALALGLVLGGCSTYQDDLARSQHAFEQNQHETALGILRMLEHDTTHLDASDRARYAYLRGMTDYRIGYKADARHWLVVAKAMDEKTPGLIPAEWRTRLDQSLAELDAQVWAGGMESLSLTPAGRKPGSGSAASKHREKKAEPASAPSSAEEEEEAAPKPQPKKKKPTADDED